MKGLMLHCGANPVTRHDVEMARPGAPRGPRHNPFPYGEFLDLIETNLALEGYEIKEQAYGLTHDDDRMFGLMEVQPVLEGEYLKAGEPDFGLMVGVRGSYDQTFPRSIALGARVFVCDNLSFSGEIVIRTKQTTNIGVRLPGLIGQAVEQLIGAANVQEKRFEHYKESTLEPVLADAMFAGMIRQEIVSPSRIGRVIEAWDNPPFEEHADGGFTFWRMHNAVTYAYRPSGTAGERDGSVRTWGRTMHLTRFLDLHSGFKAATIDREVEV